MRMSATARPTCLFVEPLGGWRHVNVTTRRTKQDFAQQMRELVEMHYPKAQQVTLVMDNLNTHRLSCLYEAVAPRAGQADHREDPGWCIRPSTALGRIWQSAS